MTDGLNNFRDFLGKNKAEVAIGAILLIGLIAVVVYFWPRPNEAQYEMPLSGIFVRDYELTTRRPFAVVVENLPVVRPQ